MPTIKKIIILTAYPFNQRDYKRFGVEILRHSGFDVEIWDITSCLHDSFKSRLVQEDPNTFKDLRVFEKKHQLVNAISSLDKTCIINCFIEYSHRTFFIFKTISKNQVRYCTWGFASFPNPIPLQQTNLWGRIKSTLKKAGSLRFTEILEHVLNKLLLKYHFLFGISAAWVIILGGEKSIENISHPVNDSTIRLWTHMPDYDIYLLEDSIASDQNGSMGVFLDEFVPFHPDFLYMGIDFVISPEQYYPKICDFFSILEKFSDNYIVIAAHPRSDYSKQPDYFCGRSVIKGNTSCLVKNSTFVVAHMSTAIDFAVLYHKPLIFITSDDLQKMNSGKNLTGLYIQTIARELGKSPINIDHLSDFSWVKEMEINEDAYHKYKNNYIKKEGTPEKPIWQVFSSYLKKEKSP